MFYTLIKFVLAPYLPAKWFVDSEKLLQIVQGGGGVEGGSFAVTAKLYALIPAWSHDLLVAAAAIACIVLTFNAVRTWRGIMLSFLVLVPMIILGLLVPSKETIVLLMSLIILATSRFSKKGIMLFLVIVGLYFSYGISIRIYYLLILGVWMGLLLLPYIPKPVTLLLGLVGLLTMCFLPPAVFEALQGSRDTVFHYTQVSTGSSRRTAFANPFPPVDALSFMGNYLYAFVLLHFPFFRFFGPNEVLLFLNVLTYGWLMKRGWHSQDRRTVMLTKLFCAHIVVLWLFEPDIGSYFRHFSSVFLYLLPILAFIEWGKEKHADISPTPKRAKIPASFVTNATGSPIIKTEKKSPLEGKIK